MNTFEIKNLDEFEAMQLLQNDNQFVLTSILRDVVLALIPLLHLHSRRLSNEDMEEVIAISLANLWHRRKYIKGNLSNNLFNLLNFKTEDGNGHS